MCHDRVKEVARESQETRNEETRNFFGIFNNRNTEMTETGTHTHRRSDINNNPQQTWGRTDYLKGNMTGNTWDEIKTQMGTN